jgi:glycosyltransferase involved in cell wall biosynthesis
MGISAENLCAPFFLLSSSIMPRILLSVINDLSGDQRMHRIASSLAEAGYEVCLIGRKLPDSLPLRPRPYQMHRMKLWFRRGKWMYLEYNLRLLFFLLRQPVDLLTANDLDTLLANYLASRWKRIPLVYDSHEYFTEVPELIHRPRTRAIWLRLERWLFPKLQHVYTVNESLARMYSATYQVPVQVIRNVPLAKSAPQLANKENILLYQGALNLGRGIELMIRAMRHLPDFQLWIVGRGDVETELQELCATEGLQERVRFHGFVPWEKLAELTVQARLGFSLEEDLGANYRYASPNKIYDYVQAAVPVLVSDLPEMQMLVAQYQLGGVLPVAERNPEALARRVKALLTDETHYQILVANCRKAAGELIWEIERARLLEIYQSALGK